MSNSVFEALANPARREILRYLRRRDMAAGELAGHFDLTKPTLSGHLNKLKAAGLVTAERRGTRLIYSINTSVLEEAMMSFMSRLGLDREGEKK